MRYRSPYILFKKTLKSGRKVWYFYYYDERNIRHQHSTGCKTKAEAEIVCLELYRSGSIPALNPILLASCPSSSTILQTDKNEKDKVPLFRDFLKTWFDYDKCEYIQSRLQFGYIITRTYAEKRRRENDLYLLPFWGNYRLDEVSEPLCDKWITYLKKKRNLSNATIKSILKGFKVLLAYAFKKDMTKTNLAKKVNMLKNNSKTHGIFTKDEVKRLFDENNIDSVWNGKTMHYTINLLASKTGLRIGEILALRKENLFPDHLLINHGWNDKLGLQDTKNHKSRIVPISNDMHRRLYEIAEAQAEGEYIFSATNGKRPLYRSDISERFKRSLAAIGIDEEERKDRFLSFHSWRHYANSRLVNSGIPKSIVQSIIGHVNDDAMTEHYTHVSLDEALRVLDVL